MTSHSIGLQSLLEKNTAGQQLSGTRCINSTTTAEWMHCLIIIKMKEIIKWTAWWVGDGGRERVLNIYNRLYTQWLLWLSKRFDEWILLYFDIRAIMSWMLSPVYCELLELETCCMDEVEVNWTMSCGTRVVSSGIWVPLTQCCCRCVGVILLWASLPVTLMYFCWFSWIHSRFIKTKAFPDKRRNNSEISKAAAKSLAQLAPWVWNHD